MYVSTFHFELILNCYILACYSCGSETTTVWVAVVVDVDVAAAAVVVDVAAVLEVVVDVVAVEAFQDHQVPFREEIRRNPEVASDRVACPVGWAVHPVEVCLALGILDVGVPFLEGTCQEVEDLEIDTFAVVLSGSLVEDPYLEPSKGECHEAYYGDLEVLVGLGEDG